MVNARRDPRTGRLISEEDYRRMAERQQTFVPGPDLPETPREPEPPFEPVRVWTAGRGMPQERIVDPNHGDIAPSSDYAYHVTTQWQYDALKRALGNRLWLDDVPEGTDSPRCDTCNWESRSYAAMLHHINVAHGKPQASR